MDTCNYWEQINSQLKSTIHLSTTESCTDPATNNLICDNNELKEDYSTTFAQGDIFKNCEPNLLQPSNKCSNIIHDHKRFSCFICGYQTSKKGHYETHIRIHTGIKPFKCKTCPFSSSDRSSLVRHEKIHSPFKALKCHLCDYRTHDNALLKVHLTNHTGEKRYQCKHCNYKTAIKSHITTHERIHSGDKPFDCSICSYRTSHLSAIKRHIKTHNKKEGKDTTSGLIVTNSIALNSYPDNYRESNAKEEEIKDSETEKILGEALPTVFLDSPPQNDKLKKVYQCEYCKYSSPKRFRLLIHKRTHTGEKPFKCDVCNYKAAEMSTVKRHQNVHLPLKRKNAQIEEQICLESGILIENKEQENSDIQTIKNIEDNRHYSCPYCDYFTPHRSDLELHKTKHDNFSEEL